MAWAIIDVDAFGLGFILGLLVGYHFLVPPSSDASEGLALLGTLLVVFAFPAVNIVLGIIAGITRNIAGRRGQPRSPSAV